MGKIYKYYDEEELQKYSMYLENSLKMVSKKFISTNPKGNIIDEDEYLLIKKLLESLRDSARTLGVGDTASFLKVKLYNRQLRKYYGLSPLEEEIKEDNIEEQNG